MSLSYLRLSGKEARPYTEDLARLRLDVFYEYPYLYEGNLDYEMNYLETYFKAKYSFLFLVLDEGIVVGATTGIWAQEEEESFRRPFLKAGINPEDVFYFGESVLAKDYRGRGLGKLFFQEREAFAKKLPFINYLSFCSVIRDEHHPLRPDDYRNLHGLWESQGFRPVDGLVTSYEWPDRGETTASKKEMQFWMKNI